MAYASVEEVVSEFKDLEVGTGTSVTDSEIGRFIDEADAYINSKLGLVYQVPITAPEAFPILRMIEVYLIKARINSILEIRSGQEEIVQNGINNAEVANKMLDNLVAGIMVLPGAIMITSKAGVSSYSHENNIEHVFDVTRTQW